MKIAMLCSYPPRYITGQKFYGARTTHVSSWNVTLVDALSRLADLDLTVITSGPLLRTQVIRKGRITYILYGRIPKIEQYLPWIKLWRIRRILLKIQPDIVHGIGNEHMYPWFALHSGFPNVVTYHGILREIWKHPGLSQRIRLQLEDEVFQNAQNVIVISPSVERLIYEGCHHNLPHRFTIPNSIAQEFCESRDTPREIDLAMVGMIYPLKNTHLLVPIVESLHNTGINISAEIFGDPVHGQRAYADSIHRDIEARGLSGSIKFRGQIENRLLPAELGRCRILLHLSDFESYSMAIREAMALGLVIVARNVGAIPDIIQDGANGILLTSSDLVNEASQIISLLLNNPAEMERIGKASSLSIRESCRPDVVAAKHYEAYRQVRSCSAS